MKNSGERDLGLLVKEAFDDSWGSVYSRIASIQARFDDSLHVNVLQALSPSEGEIVLDAATGSGIWAHEVASQAPNSKVLGVDFSTRMLELAREQSGQLRIDNVNYVASDIVTLCLRNHSVDKIICSKVLGLVSNKSEVVAELFRVLRPEGIMVLIDQFQGKGWRKYLSKVIGGLFYVFIPSSRTTVPLYTSLNYTESDLGELLEGVGFLDVEIQIEGFLAFVVAHKPRSS